MNSGASPTKQRGAKLRRAPELPRAQPLDRRRLQCYLALILGDIAALFASYMLSGYLYLGVEGVEQAALLAQLVLPIFLTVALYNGSYSISTLEEHQRGILRSEVALLISAAMVVFIAFYAKASTDFSRVNFTGGLVLSLMALAWIRLQMRGFVHWRCGARVTNELIIADGGPEVNLSHATRIDAAALQLNPRLDDPHVLDRIGLVLASIDRVVVSCPPERRLAWSMILKGANVAGEVLDDAVAELGATGARQAGGHGWLRVSIGPLGLRARAMKRIFDFSLALAGLLLLSPMLLGVALAIVIENGLPVFFVQRRVGRGNRFFNMVKFRSMRVERSDASGAVSASRSDERITRVGRFIRRTSIDELPQLINVLTGEMSIVGPRPHALGSQAGDKLFWEVDDRYWQRHALKPGLTGLAQVRGLRGATDQELDLQRRLNADLEYLAGWSLLRDLRIVLSTIRVLVHERAF